MIAFAPAHEEQGRKTLHSRWEIWVKELSSDIRESLWNENETIQKLGNLGERELVSSRERFNNSDEIILDDSNDDITEI